MNTLDLKYAITKGERTVTTLVFPERILVKHLMAGDGYEYPSVKREIAILSSLTGESEIVLRELDSYDWIKAEAIVNKLLTESENQTESQSEEKKRD